LSPEQRTDSEALRHELSCVLQSPVFEKAQRSQRFLRYLVEAALADPPVAVKEYTVAIDVFDRGTHYDPAVDATVRVEASRLRSRLREYYAEEGRDHSWQIDVPKGGYSVAFTPKLATASDASEIVAFAEMRRAEATPPPTPARHWPWVVASVFLLTVIAGSAVAWHYRRSRSVVMPSQPVSLAIFPIVNRTGDSELDYVAAGLSDDLIRQLSQVPALRLIGRTTMFRYRDLTADATTIAKSLHVDTMMSGELRRSRDHTSFAVELTSVSDGSVLLSREYIADARDLPTAQADLQSDVLEKLHAESSARDPGRTLRSVTSSPEAYQEFLKGAALARTNAPADLQVAIGHFEKAAALDPHFDLAWSALGSAHLFLATYFDPPREQMPLARQFAQHALRINPALGEAHGSLGLIHLLYDWDLSAAEIEMSTAGAEPAAIGTLTCTAHLMSRTGKSRSAEEMLGRLLTYDPQSAALIAELGCVDFYRGNYDSALRHYHDALQVDPQTPVAYWGIGKSLNAMGRHDEAIKALRSFKQRNGFEPPLITAEIGYALAASGHRADALELIHSLSSAPAGRFIDPYFVSIIYLALSQSKTASPQDLPAAFAWLNKALDARSSFVISILTEPKWQPFVQDPRFGAAVQRLLTKKA
jgi:TolB-like protein/Tfp pilus assembly protein PilF